MYSINVATSEAVPSHRQAEPCPDCVPTYPPMVNRLTLTRESFPEPGAMDVAVSHSVLQAVSEGSLGGVFRLHVPAPVMAFGRADRVTPGYREAVRAARAHGYAAVERLAGGRAAVFHEGTLAFSWVIPDPEPRAGITERFEMTAELMAEAFQSLGIDARVGELPGEYCPGPWSVNVGGRVKVMGVGQRLVRGAAHVGGVVVVDGGERIRDVLIPVYRALELDWDPRTAGSLADRFPGLDTTVVAEAIVASFSTRFDLVEGKLPAAVVQRASGLLEAHLPEVA
jgi:octanoyl-[GcvH]:protein N-octanoyltransferase